MSPIAGDGVTGGSCLCMYNLPNNGGRCQQCPQRKGKWCGMLWLKQASEWFLDHLRRDLSLTASEALGRGGTNRSEAEADTDKQIPDVCEPCRESGEFKQRESHPWREIWSLSVRGNETKRRGLREGETGRAEVRRLSRSRGSGREQISRKG